MTNDPSDMSERDVSESVGSPKEANRQVSTARAYRPVAIDLFSGAGGLSLGFEMAGFDVVSAVEYDPVHAATHLYNFPLTDVICRDVSDVTHEMLVESARRGWKLHNPGLVETTWDGQVDVLIGGPSCQGFSVMGKQDINDSRNQLVLQFVRLVEELKPRAFCMENVPGFLHSQFSVLREEAIRRFKAAGYAVSGDETVLKAVDFGVPQKRRRVVITGVLNGAAVKTPTSTAIASTVADAFYGLPKPSDYSSTATGDQLVLSLDDWRAIRQTNEYLTLGDIIGDGSGTFGHSRRTEGGTLTGFRATVHKPESIVRFDATGQGMVEKISRAYRLAFAKPANTLRAGTGRERGAFSASRPIHPAEPRVILVREAARLHSFPDWFRFHTTNWHGHRQIGNAVPPLLARAVAAATMVALGYQPMKSDHEPLALGAETLLSLTPTEAALLLEAHDEQVPKRMRQVRADADEAIDESAKMISASAEAA